MNSNLNSQIFLYQCVRGRNSERFFPCFCCYSMKLQYKSRQYFVLISWQQTEQYCQKITQPQRETQAIHTYKQKYLFYFLQPSPSSLLFSAMNKHFPKFEGSIIQCFVMLSNMRSLMFPEHFQFESLSRIVFYIRSRL